MSRPSEYWSEELAHSSGKPDANLAANALQLGGIDAEDFATKKYVQEYHKAKELLLKDYIDAQDLAKLQEAKDYVDTMIRNQDFSMFAKVTDLQTLSQILNAKIEACKTECQQEMNTRINAVVNDVNNNFDDVNGAISQLNSKTNELFTSVSNGKDLVADAITDKGIHTSATDSYSTMAQNIRNIETSGGGDYDENYVNTSDGNAAANDIALGKIAYAKGQKIFGTHEDIDTSDATATENDIRQGKTAYVNGEKKIGTLNASEYPTIGTDTSNATATAEDIALGKTAYARGQYLIGTSQFNREVEEVYAQKVENYNVKTTDIGLTTYPDSIDKITHRGLIAFSKDGNYCVSAVFLNESNASGYKDFYIESHPVNENGMIINSSAGLSGDTIYKKYRYSKEELGISEDETISEINIGSNGLLGYSDRCLLLIRTNQYLHFYTYHLSENGVIGKSYENERYIINNYKVENNFSNWNISIFSNTNPCKLFAFSSKNQNLFMQEIELNISIVEGNEISNIAISRIIHTIASSSSGSVYFPVDDLQISISDKYISSGGYRYSGACSVSYIELDENLNYKSSQSEQYSDYYFALELHNYKMILNGKNITINNKNITLNSARDFFFGKALITPDETKLIVLFGTMYSNIGIYEGSLIAYIYDLEEIINAEDNSSISPIQTLNINNTITGLNWKIVSNNNGTNIKIFYNYSMQMYSSSLEKKLYILTSESNVETLIGIKYKNQFFRSIKSGLYSATPSDVIKGKTFIGYDGSVQTGTLENSTEMEEQT